MHIDEAIRTRRAIKGYDTQHSLSREEKDELLKLALLAPAALASFERFLKIAWVVRKKSIKRSWAAVGQAAPAAPEKGAETEARAASEKADGRADASAGESADESKSASGSEDPGEGRAPSPAPGAGSGDPKS